MMRKIEVDDIVKDSLGNNIRLRFDDLEKYNDYEPIELSINWFSRQGFNISIIEGISSYLIQYNDLKMIPVSDTETKELIGFGVISGTHYDDKIKCIVMDVVSCIKPIKYVHEVQHLLRLCEYNDFEKKLKI